MKLTKEAIAKLALPAGKAEAEVWDDDIPGFGVRLRPHSTQWIFRYRRAGRQRRMTVGNVTAITATQARTIASQLYAKVKLGGDPAGDRADTLARANETFELALRPYLLRKQAELRPRSFTNVERHLLKHAAPLHRLELAKAAERRTVATLLAKIAGGSGPGEANSMKGSLSGFFTWAIGQGLLDGTDIEIDPTAAIANAPTNGPRSHVPTDAEIVKIWHALPDGDYGDIIKLLTLTLSRLSEIADLSWEEIDFTASVIRLPGKRTKTGVARAVPMSAPVKAILQRRKQQWNGKRALVFGTTGQRGFTGWTHAKRQLDARSGVTGWTHHDLRRFGSTTMNNEALAVPHIVESTLGHVVGTTISRNYNLAAYEQQVRTALELWGSRVMQLVSGGRKPAGVLAYRRRRSA